MRRLRPLFCAIAVVFTACGALEENEWTTMARSSRFFPGLVVWGSFDTMRVITDADRIYVIPVWLTEKRTRTSGGGTIGTVKAHGDYKHARLLDSQASRALKRILARQGSWFHGHDDTMWAGPVPRNVGYIFHRGKDELVLLGCMPQNFDGSFNGASTDGTLEEEAAAKLAEWKKRYAKDELGTE